MGVWIGRRQSDAGIDGVADGEMGRLGFIPYVNERLTGIEPSATAENAKLQALAGARLASAELWRSAA